LNCRPPVGGKNARPTTLPLALNPSMNPPPMRISPVAPAPQLPPPSASWTKLMLANWAHAAKAWPIWVTKSAGKKLDKSTVWPVKNDCPVWLVQPALAILQVTVPPVVPNVPEGPHLVPVVAKSSGAGTAAELASSLTTDHLALANPRRQQDWRATDPAGHRSRRLASGFSFPHNTPAAALN
jgi:hypothetical protein